MASRRELPVETRLELAAVKEGAVLLIDFILSGGLDTVVADILELPTKPAAPPADYMRTYADAHRDTHGE